MEKTMERDMEIAKGCRVWDISQIMKHQMEKEVEHAMEFGLVKGYSLLGFMLRSTYRHV